MDRCKIWNIDRRVANFVGGCEVVDGARTTRRDTGKTEMVGNFGGGSGMTLGKGVRKIYILRVKQIEDVDVDIRG